MTELKINTSQLHAHVLPIFWPVLWLNLYLLRRWYAQHGETIGGVAVTTSHFGVIQITNIYPRADADLAYLRLFENTTEDWCMDQLGFTADMFARANRVKLRQMCGWLCELIATGCPPQPAVNDSS